VQFHSAWCVCGFRLGKYEVIDIEGVNVTIENHTDKDDGEHVPAGGKHGSCTEHTEI